MTNKSHLTVCSWNVNSINARFDRIKSFLKRVAPDIVCLQELKCIDEKFPTAELNALGYHSAIFGQRTYNGVAILSKDTMTDVELLYPLPDDEQARLITAVTFGIRVLSAYIPNGQSVGSDKYTYKLAWMQGLADLLPPYIKKDHVVLCGDFNVAPDDIDVHAPEQWRGKILFSDKERRALQTITQTGLIDTLRLNHPHEQIFSWWDYRQLSFQRNAGLRIDFIYASQALSQHCSRAWVERNERKGDKPSDHAPCMAEFELPI